MGNITIRDIALQAGVSKSTASRVINNVGTVSEELRDRVNAVIERVGYQPSAIAQGLSRQDSTLIGVLVPTVSDSFFGQILQGIIETTSQKNYTIVLCTHDNDPECEKRALRALRSQRIKGLLITPAAGYIKREDKNYLRTELEILDVPTVLIDRGIKMSSWDGVYYDNYNGAYLAIETIVKNGFRSIGCMVSDMALQIGKDRMRGVQQAIAVGGSGGVSLGRCGLFGDQLMLAGLQVDVCAQLRQGGVGILQGSFACGVLVDDFSDLAHNVLPFCHADLYGAASAAGVT